MSALDFFNVSSLDFFFKATVAFLTSSLIEINNSWSNFWSSSNFSIWVLIAWPFIVATFSLYSGLNFSINSDFEAKELSNLDGEIDFSLEVTPFSKSIFTAANPSSFLLLTVLEGSSTNDFSSSSISLSTLISKFLSNSWSCTNFSPSNK